MNRLEPDQKILITHGLVSILISLILGWVLGIAMLQDWPSRAHLRGIHVTALQMGFLLILFGLVTPFTSLSEAAKRRWGGLLALGGYLFYLPAILGVMWGVGGLQWTSDIRNDVVFILGTVGTLLISAAVPVLAWGVLRGERRQS